jgi:hypothetical protein
VLIYVKHYLISRSKWYVRLFAGQYKVRVQINVRVTDSVIFIVCKCEHFLFFVTLEQELGRFHPFHRPRRPLGRVEV